MEDAEPQGSLDLTNEAATSELAAPLRREPYDPSRDRERVRGTIAKWLILLLVAIIAALLGGVFAGRLTVDELERVAAVIISPVVGLLGAVLGFYYGEQSRNRTG